MCGRAFANDVAFCLDDGSQLVTAARSAADTPTQIIAPLRTTPDAKLPTRSPLIYVLVGAMAVTIAGLGFLLYSKKDDPPKTVNITVPTPAPSATISANTPSNVAAEPPRSITEADASALIDRWTKAQNARNFAAYRDCYSTELVAIKDTTKGSPDRMSYAEWMNDRQKSMKNIVAVDAEDTHISIQGSVAVVRFRQRWRSLRYCDIGAKEITIKMLPEGPKIVSEKITDPIPC